MSLLARQAARWSKQMLSYKTPIIIIFIIFVIGGIIGIIIVIGVIIIIVIGVKYYLFMTTNHPVHRLE